MVTIDILIPVMSFNLAPTLEREENPQTFALKVA